MSLTLTSTTLTFEIKKEIGQIGKNSNVYLAHDNQLDCDIAVKKLLKSKITDKAKFFEEARRLHDSEHPHVVPIKFASEDSNNIYLAMPFYALGSLNELIEKKFLSVREIVRYSIQFLLGLH